MIEQRAGSLRKVQKKRMPGKAFFYPIQLPVQMVWQLRQLCQLIVEFISECFLISAFLTRKP